MPYYAHAASRSAGTDQTARVRFDRIIEKHEGPFDWSWFLDDAEFLDVEGAPVLLPIQREHHTNIRLLRSVKSADQETLIVYLKDTTFEEDSLFAGRLAVCERFPGAEFYVAMAYHEWFAVPRLAEAIHKPEQ